MKIKRLLAFLLIIILLGLLAYFYPQVESLATGKSISQTNANYQKEPAFVNRVIDGDTIVVTGPLIGNQTHIRFLGMNTPEHNQPYYEEPKDYLINEIENKSVELLRDTIDTDRYGRKLRYVFYQDSLINVEIVQQGLAPTFMLDGLKYKDKFISAEKFARESNLNLWKKSTDECANCIELEKLDSKQEFFIIKNSCNFNCNLNGWFVKDDANHFFYLNDLQGGQEETYNSSQSKDSNGKAIKTGVWNDDHDRFFMRDNNGYLVLFYEY